MNKTNLPKSIVCTYLVRLWIHIVKEELFLWYDFQFNWYIAQFHRSRNRLPKIGIFLSFWSEVTRYRPTKTFYNNSWDLLLCWQAHWGWLGGATCGKPQPAPVGESAQEKIEAVVVGLIVEPQGKKIRTNLSLDCLNF